MNRSSSGIPPSGLRETRSITGSHAKILVPLAAGAALISARSASAQFVSGDASLTLTSGMTGGFDVNNDGTNDFTITVGTSNSTKPQISTAGSATDISLGAGTTYPYSYGDTINSSSGTGVFATSTNLSQTSGNYVGFTLNAAPGSGSELYGWAQINYSYDDNVATVGDYAYNETPGQGILAGEEMAPVPEPADTALIFGAAALLAGSLAIWRKREQAAQAAA
jgi:hypothetical protein